MTDLFGRYYELLIGDLLIRELNIQFKAIRTDEKAPNTLDMTILNRSKKEREALQRVKEVPVQLAAGYTDKFGVIYLGIIREIYSTRNGVTWETVLGSGDGEKAQKNGRISKSFAPGVSYETVLKEAAKSLPNISKGNIDRAASLGKLPGNSKEFVNGVTLSGNAAREFDRLIKSAGLEWSIQNETLQILEAKKALDTEAVVLTPETGLIGSPTIASDGTVNFTSLMESDIIPGKQVRILSEHVDAYVKTKRVEYNGDFEGNDWYVQGEGELLNNDNA